jgi:chromosome segregation ATPase
MQWVYNAWHIASTGESNYVPTIAGSTCLVGILGCYGYLMWKKCHALQNKINILEKQHNDIKEQVIKVSYAQTHQNNEDIKYFAQRNMEQIKYVHVIDNKCLLLNDMVNQVEQEQALVSSRIKWLINKVNLLITNQDNIKDFMVNYNKQYKLLEEAINKNINDIEVVNERQTQYDRDLYILKESMKEAPEVVDHIFYHIGEIKKEVDGFNQYLLRIAKTEAKLNALCTQLEGLGITTEFGD